MTDITLTTKDIYFAAALLASGMEMGKVDRSDSQHIRFTFNGDELKAMEADWINGGLTGSFSAYAEAVRKIKSLIHARNDN